MENQLKKGFNIFEYDDFRHFLRDYYQTKKIEDPDFSYRSFSKAAGLQSSGNLKRVMDGARNLSSDGIEKFAMALGLKKEKKKYFEALVHFNQAKNPSKKEFFAEKILKIRSHQKIEPLALHKFDYWSGWYNPVIREMIGLKGFEENSKWVSERIIPEITPLLVSQSLKKLLNLKLVKRNDKGELVLTKENLTSGDQVLLASFAKFHRQMAKRGMEAVDRFDKTKRQVTGLTLSLNQQKVEKIMALINKFGKDLLAISNEDDENDQVFQINFQVFPVSQKLKEDPKT